MRIRSWLLRLAGRASRTENQATRPTRGPATHVIILDGTMSTLEPGRETNAGLTLKLLEEQGRSAGLTIYYEAGIQWRDWANTMDVLVGRGINRQIRRAYGVLASRYRPGDRIVLMGYSRGAYAVRSLAGIIDRVGLVRSDHATVRNIRQAYRHYQAGGRGPVAEAFRAGFCHPEAPIEAVAVWDTVKSLGLRIPLIWQLLEDRHRFHNHALGASVRHGFHALALDETRRAYAPVMWHCPPGWSGHVEQVWFRGCHGDIGGQLGGRLWARPLSNISLVWMLERIERCGVALPDGWRGRFEQDVTAPTTGTWSGWGKFFVLRERRLIGQDRSERLHDSLARHPGPLPPGAAVFDVPTAEGAAQAPR